MPATSVVLFALHIFMGVARRVITNQFMLFRGTPAQAAGGGFTAMVLNPLPVS